MNVAHVTKAVRIMSELFCRFEIISTKDMQFVKQHISPRNAVVFSSAGLYTRALIRRVHNNAVTINFSCIQQCCNN